MKKNFYKIFPTSGIKQVKSALLIAEKELNNPSFHIVKADILEIIYNNPKGLKELLKNEKNALTLVYNNIGHIAADHVESGKYHIYRGLLNPMGPGENLLKLYCDSMDILVKMGIHDKETIEIEKGKVRENIKLFG